MHKSRFFRLFKISVWLMLLGFTASALQSDPPRWLQRQRSITEQTDRIVSRYNAGGYPIEVEFLKGPAHNHPLMAVWIEDMDRKYIQTLFVATSIGKGVFRYGDATEGIWMPGPIRRPAALPYWSHKRGVLANDGFYLPTPEDPMPDGITGPTPKHNFILEALTPEKSLRQFRVMFEINQPWDWNHFWTNNKYPGDANYMTSSQPSLIYEAIVDLDLGPMEYAMRVIGHGHWSGQNGNLYEDLSTITTALDITRVLIVRVLPE